MMMSSKNNETIDKIHFDDGVADVGNAQCCHGLRQSSIEQ